ncbi:hypothetical protein AB833_31860 [Chromatiales bacterium (ex Bugula neritina AB1)]|nr:hypothetical protein AB833_31860 [Chromatiales bacterium (ex Bugula neritina AB1)]
MPRLSNVVANERAHLESLECPTFENTAFVSPRPLKDCRVALVSSAGLMQRKGKNISGSSAQYQSFDRSIRDRDLLINHVSVNFDRSGYSEDVNTVFPRELLNELADDGVIAGVSDPHYSFMGATAPEKMREYVDQLATELKENSINTVCLLPV